MFVFVFCCKLYQHLATSSMHDIVQMDGSFITADQFAYRLSRCLQLACISLSWRMAHAAVVWKRFAQTLVQRVFDCRGSWMKVWARTLFENISALRGWTCTSRKWHNFFLRVEEIVVFLYSCCRHGRAFDLPQRCEKNCSHVPSPLNIEQVIGKNCITLEWAIVDKGTSFFSQGRGNKHFFLERKVWGHNSEIPQRKLSFSFIAVVARDVHSIYHSGVKKDVPMSLVLWTSSK